MNRTSSILVILAVSCAVSMGGGESSAVTGLDPVFERAPSPTARIAWEELDGVEDVAGRIDAHFASHGTDRMHIQLDRPLYRPGESVWLKTWLVRSFDFNARGGAVVTYELVNPRGQVVQTKSVQQGPSQGTNDFVLPADAPGGKWTLRASASTGEVDERPFIVSNYQAPRIKKSLDFVREAYGPGDTVEALVELETQTGEPLADHPVRVMLQVDGQVLTETTVRTTKDGAVLATGELPAELQTGDGLLTVLVEQGGMTESISRSVPIVLADASLAFFPEGGDLVNDLPGRVYFEAKNQHGEPADVTGHVVDDRGRKVADFSSLHDGLGRFAFTPRKGRTYSARITSLPGLEAEYPLPIAKPAGCVLRSFDDPETKAAQVRVGVRCSSEREVVVSGVLRERTLDAGAVKAGPNRDAVVYLDPGEERSDQQGAVRVTVFDANLAPLAERLVYRNHGRNLSIDITTDQLSYGPRDEVIVDVTTRDPSGDPVAAEVALSVVDDAVLSFADDENGDMLTRLYLEPELVESPEDPSFYFNADEPDAARAMDLVMGTKGYRRFEWAPVWNPAPLSTVLETRTTKSLEFNRQLAGAPVAANEVLMAVPGDAGVDAMLPHMAGGGMPMEPPMEGLEHSADDDDFDAAEDIGLGGLIAFDVEEEEHGLADEIAVLEEAKDIAWGRAERRARRENIGRIGIRGGYAAVRVFPKPDYKAGFSGPRTDFRDTVHWEPSVTTGAKGTAQVRFYLSDAVTSFRITAEGLGGDFAGHSEATIQSVLPVSLATRLPPAVSVGDRLMLPITTTSTREGDLDVQIRADLDSGVLAFAEGALAEQSLTLSGAGTETVFVPVDVGQGRETATLRLSAEGGGLSDTVVKSLNVVPAGFPQTWTASGNEALDTQRYVLELSDVVPHSLTATATWHPSPESTLITGMEGLIRTPGGCFEQTSSTNWPNVAILNYLDAHDGDPRLKVKSAQALQVGYAKLTGYQVGEGGFETFGSGPGKEALSAFGLLQFSDMSRVHDVDAEMMARDVAYLMSARDGKGGYTRTGESAHGYGSAPPEVLNAFITYALVETGHTDGLEREIGHQADQALTTKDPYVLALATRTLLRSGHAAGPKALKRLVGMQAADGSFPGATSSITRSYEANLLVESTALAALAMMEGDHRPGADRAADWLVKNRHGGTWGATQATALALGALTEHAQISKVPASAGAVKILVNGSEGGILRYDADDRDALVLDRWADLLVPGKNVIELVQLSGEPMPYAIDVGWTSITPVTSPGAELGLSTRLASESVKLGETVRLTASIDNQLERVVPSPIARIGLPAGLEAQTWQLEEMQERGEIAFFETRDREVTLYWEGIHPTEVHEVKLDLVATVPGHFTAPASSAYPYYDDDEKAWSAGSVVTVSVK